MQQDHLKMTKQKLLEEILSDRKRLDELNNEINEVGSSISFWQFFLIPLAISIIIVLIAYQFGIRGNQAVGILVVSLIILITATTVIGKTKIAHKKEKLIIDRMTVQQEIVAKTKRLHEIEKQIDG